MHRALLLLAVLSLSILYSEPSAAQDTFPKAQPQSNTDSRNEAARKLHEQGLALMEAGKLPEAAESFQQALQFEPEFADAYAALGRTYFKMREWQKAVDNLNRAAVLKSKQRESGKAAPVTQTTASRERRAESSEQNTKPVIQINPAQSSNAAAPSAPLKAYNRYSLNRKNAEIVSSNESVSSTINLRNLLPQPSETLNELKQTETQSVATGAPVVSKDVDQSKMEKTETGAAVPQPETSSPFVKETSAPEVLPGASIEETSLTKIYRVGANDVLDVRLNDGPEQQSTFYTVTATGLLEHPLLNEPMLVAGLTVEEIASRIDADLRRRAIAENAKAFVGVKDYASHPVLVSGLVKESGTKFLRREAIPLYVVVADAQPLPEAAKVTVIRDAERSQIYDVDLNRVADMDFLVHSGDVITLRPNPTQFIYIGGEIKSPGEKTFRRGLTLMQVVLAAGGLDPKAKIAEIANNNEDGFLVSTRFKLKDIVAGKVIDPLLKPGDRISILR